MKMDEVSGIPKTGVMRARVVQNEFPPGWLRSRVETTRMLGVTERPRAVLRWTGLDALLLGEPEDCSFDGSPSATTLPRMGSVI